MSCGKFVFPSHYLPLPILEVMSPVDNRASHLVICHFPSWKSQLLLGSPMSCGKIRIPISLPATSHLGSPMSRGKFVLPSHYLPLPVLEVPSVFPSHYLPLLILDVPSTVVNSSSHLIACHFPSWTSHLLW